MLVLRQAAATATATVRTSSRLVLLRSAAAACATVVATRSPAALSTSPSQRCFSQRNHLIRMPADAASQDPYVEATQHDASPKQKVEELQKIIGDAKTTMLTTTAADGTLHSRAMAPASKEAPFKFEFIANSESGKFEDIQSHSKVNVAVYDSNSTNWISVAGEAKISNDVTRIKEIWNPLLSAWFGKIDDKHDGTPEDPRVQLITVEPYEIRYWYKTQTQIGQLANIVVSAATGKTANPGYLRTVSKAELAQARS